MIAKVRALGSLEGGWLFVLLVLLTILPAACVLWFMNEAVARESDAAKQRVLDAYRGQLRLVRSRLDGVWRAQATRLNATGAPDRRFAELITGELADGVVVLGDDGLVRYPDRRIDHTTAFSALERHAATIATLTPAERPHEVAAVAAALNDYTTPLSASSRLLLMDRLRGVAPQIWLATQAALRLSIDLLEAERPAPVPNVVRQTALHDVWALTSSDARVIGLYRTGRIEAMMHDFLHEISPAGIVFIAFPPDERANAEAIAAGPWLPGWQLSFVPLDLNPFDPVAARRRSVYLSVAVVGVALMTLVGAAAGGGLRRHLRLARLKTDLVAAASHELRTPLASMRVLVEGLLADPEIDPVKTREYLQLLATENARLGRVIENFLTFSRLDRHRRQFALTRAEPAAIVTAAVDAVRERMPPTASLNVDVAEQLPCVRADVEAVSTALVNLVDNALKYTPAAKQIAIRVRRDGERWVTFAVADNGSGVPAAERRRIFRPFYQIDRRLSRDTGGVGLGLSIVDLIARGHRGSVRVESNAGAGSTFELRIPIAKGGPM